MGIVLNDPELMEAYRYHKWVPLQHKPEDLGYLGAMKHSSGTFGDCPAFAKVPAFDDKGILAIQ